MSDIPNSDTQELRRTALHDLHVDAGARMVDFAGWSMPVQYESAKDEHLHTRTATSLFDVGHMAVVDLRGADAATALEALTPSAVTDLAIGRSRYMVMTNGDGGVIDDLIATRVADDLVRVVANASRADIDIAHLRANLGAGVEVVVRDDLGLLAIQGPTSAQALAAVDEDPGDLVFLDGRPAAFGDDTWISRSGYTGEDGFEVVAPHDVLQDIAQRLLARDDVAWAGLAARDSLRLEAGLCLYGNDLDETTTPIEAGLVWTIPKARRGGGSHPGADVIADQVEHGPSRRLRGLAVTGRRPVRDGATLSLDGREVGTVTSGGWGASVDAPVAMGYVAADVAPGTELVADVRGSDVAVTVVTLPHVPHRYVR